VRHALLPLLATPTSCGSFSTGGPVPGGGRAPSILLTGAPPPAADVSEAPPPKKARKGGGEPLAFPLDEASRARLLEAAAPAGVGGPGAVPGGSVVIPEARVTGQLLPGQLEIGNGEEFERETLGPIMDKVKKDLGMAEDAVKPELYTLLHDTRAFPSPPPAPPPPPPLPHLHSAPSHPSRSQPARSSSSTATPSASPAWSARSSCRCPAPPTPARS
jgi:hypothetical protein